MIFQLSDWFPKPMIWTIIVKFDQIRKNWWRISCAEILEVGKNFFAASSEKKMSRFEEVSPEEIKRIAWKFTKTVILLGLAGYEPTASLVILVTVNEYNIENVALKTWLFSNLIQHHPACCNIVGPNYFARRWHVASVQPGLYTRTHTLLGSAQVIPLPPLLSTACWLNI